MKEFLIRLLWVCLLSFFPLGMAAQDRGPIQLKGRVTDARGEVLPGANVLAYDAQQHLYGTTTDVKGVFRLDVPADVHLFSVQMLGFEQERVKVVAGKRFYDVTLRDSSQAIDNVVVTGYLNKRKESYTGSTHVIRREEIESMVHTNVLNIIQMQTPGFEIFDDVVNGSDPNKVPDMVLRGRSSFIEGDNTNVPLFILDGTEVDIAYVFDMPSEDIESISVLKDAAATSFYGSKAANGVVVITTRPTQAGKLHVNYSGDFQVTVPDLSDYDLLNAAQKLEYERLAGVYGDFKGDSQDDVMLQKLYYERLDRVNDGVNTDWKRMALRTGFNHIHHLMLSGGSQDFRYHVSGSYNGTKGVMDESEKNVASLRIHLTYGNLDKLFFQNITSLSHHASDDVPYGSFADYVSLNPYDRAYNTDGSLNNNLSFDKANPLYEKNLNSFIEKRTGSFMNTFRLRWNIVKDLRMEASLSYRQSKNEGETFYSPLSKRFFRQDPMKKGSFDLSNGTTQSISGNAFIVWNKGWGERHRNLLSLSGGFNIESARSETHTFSAVGVLSDKLEHPSMATAYAESRPGGGEDYSRLLGFYVNANYIWSNRYFVDFSFRYEGSSKFGTDNKYAPFGAIGLGWNIHQERFLKDSFVSLLKLRASMGYVGNAGFNPYQAQLSFQYGSHLIYNGSIGAVPVAMVNPHLKWERSLKRNIGLDFGFWKERFSGSVDVYYDTTNDLVMSIAKPGHIGFSNAKENLGRIRNSGVEVSLRGNVLQRRETNLNLFMTMSHNRNRIIEISDYLKNKNKENESNSSSQLPAAFYEEGESMTALKVMLSAGINPANGREVFIRRNGEYTYEYDYREKQVVGDTSPKVQGGFGFSFSWRSFDFTMHFSYRLGATLYNQTLATKVEGANPAANADRRVFFDRWKAPGDFARYKDIASREMTPPTSRFVATEYALEGSSMKISYTLPDALSKSLHLRRIRVSASMGDWFNLSSIRRERGLTYPFARTFQASLNITL